MSKKIKISLSGIKELKKSTDAKALEKNVDDVLNSLKSDLLKTLATEESLANDWSRSWSRAD